MSDKTTIQIDKKIKARLDDCGKKGDTYQEIVERLLISYEKAKEAVKLACTGGTSD